MNTNQPDRDATVGVLLMTYGAARGPEEVPAYLDSVYRGRAPADLVAEFQRRYRLVGGSPLVETTRAQAAALEALLNGEDARRGVRSNSPTHAPAGAPTATAPRTAAALAACHATRNGASNTVPVDGVAPVCRFRVEAGMQHTAPTIAEGLGRLAGDGADRVVAVVMSPQYSPIIMGGYLRKLEAARAEVAPELEVMVAGTWHTEPLFVEALARRVREALDRVPPEARASVPVILTAHSLPESVVQREPHYIDQLKETVRAVAEAVPLAPGRWRFAYQSAGHAPEPWLTPDMKDLLPGIAEEGHRHVLMVPVQFLADHLETLYDIDVAAGEEAEEVGLGFHRIEMFDTWPQFIEVLAHVVQRELANG